MNYLTLCLFISPLKAVSCLIKLRTQCVITRFISLTLYYAILTCYIYFLKGFSMNLRRNLEFEVLEGSN